MNGNNSLGEGKIAGEEHIAYADDGTGAQNVTMMVQIPLHRYFLQAMDIMYANLKNGTAIPASQVVRTTPRGGTPGAAPAITLNVPD